MKRVRGRGRPSENSRIIAFFQRTQRKRDEDGGEKMEAYETNAGTQATCRWLASHCHGPHRESDYVSERCPLSFKNVRRKHRSG